MMLNAKDEQMAMDYIIYMMMGSFFPSTKTDAPSREKIMRLRYRLLRQKTQYELEERCDRYFERRIRPALPGEFLKGEAKVSWVSGKNGIRTAVVFERAGLQLWVTARYGGKIKTPGIRHWIVKAPDAVNE